VSVAGNEDFTILQSAYRHGVDTESILLAIAEPIWSYFYENRTVALVLGFDRNGDTIEVAYDFAERIVFHAMPVKREIKRIKR
jgi:hypothetical protein